ncbi:MAG: TetR/AcrR family transcriptional regulator [Prevotellaceae bacterium]|jgi:AcrR family transcriptional regulator|nr:TetR/AcrR family transcriptional regulator [Prevotellaceae bacterium]
MKPNDSKTEQAILEAAKKVFLQKGLKGATTQEIADEAGVNKALLHYYYRTKESLYLAVFANLIKTNVPPIASILISRQPVAETVRRFVSAYFELLSSNFGLANFLIMDLQQNPARIIGLFTQMDPSRIFRILNARLLREGITHITAEHLMMNMASMCFFPFIIRPLIEGALFKNDEAVKREFLAQRQQVVTEFILNALKK